MRKFKVTLDREERDSLVAITQKGNHQSRKVLNALILLNCDRGKFQDRWMKNEDVAAVLKISMLYRPWFLGQIRSTIIMQPAPAQEGAREPAAGTESQVVR